jgi:hypothetical protein
VAVSPALTSLASKHMLHSLPVVCTATWMLVLDKLRPAPFSRPHAQGTLNGRIRTWRQAVRTRSP